MPRPARLLASGLALATLSALPALGAPAIWRVSDSNSSIHLFGSFHVLPEGIEWRTPLFDQLLEAADTVVFETDIGPLAQAEIGAKAFVRGIYADGTLLTDVIGDETEARLRSVSAEYGVPVGSILAMRPWMAANTISVAAMAQAGYGLQGVEVTINPEIAPERLAFLETGDEQLDVLSGAPEDEQIAMLEATLEQMDILDKVMEKMMKHWMAGTPDQLGHLFLMEMGGYETAFMERLIYARNRNWLAAPEQFLAGDTNALVVVGAAHMIGEGGVTDLLAQAGYAVERVQ